jgi:uncharacterized membrane protein HdeD (DUF308 family)
MLQAVNTQVVVRNWWMLAIRGVLALIFGLIVLFFPGIALIALITVFAVYAVIDGVVAIIVSLRERGSLNRWAWLLVEGILSVVAGILAFIYPGETALILLYIVAAWAILTGIMEIVAAVLLREYISREWALAVAGIISIVFGILLAVLPGVGLLSLLWLLGIYSIVFGVLFIVRAFQLRSWAATVTTTAS